MLHAIITGSLPSVLYWEDWGTGISSGVHRSSELSFCLFSDNFTASDEFKEKAGSSWHLYSAYWHLCDTALFNSTDYFPLEISTNFISLFDIPSPRYLFGNRWSAARKTSLLSPCAQHRSTSTAAGQSAPGGERCCREDEGSHSSCCGENGRVGGAEVEQGSSQ